MMANGVPAKLLRLRGPKNEEKEESTDQGNNDTCEEQEIQDGGDVIRNGAPLQRGLHPPPIAIMAPVEVNREEKEK